MNNKQLDAITESLGFAFRRMDKNFDFPAGTSGLMWALIHLDSQTVDTLYRGLRIYDRSLTPEDNCGHSVSEDIHGVLALFPEDAKERYENHPCTRLDEGEHDALITDISSCNQIEGFQIEGFQVYVNVEGSGDTQIVNMSKNDLETMFLKVSIPEGTAPDTVRDFPCRVLIEDHMGDCITGDGRPRPRIAAFLLPTEKTLKTTAKWALERAQREANRNSAF